MVADGVDVEEHRAGDVGGREFARPSRFMAGRYQEASTMARPGWPSRPASHSVETSGEAIARFEAFSFMVSKPFSHVR